jgi:cytoskeletal protein CcmA (bactofilin family)
MNINGKSNGSVVDVNDVSHVSAGTVVKGEMTSLTDIRVDGTVQGKLFSKGKVVVGEGAVIAGTLACNNVDFWGSIEGDVYVKDTLSLKSTATVSGNIHVRRFEVEMGAQINGTCKMISEDDYEAFIKDVIGEDIVAGE